MASIIVDPGFDTGFTGTWASSSNFGGGNFPSGTGVAASGAVIYDDGWLTFADTGGGNPRWEISAGVASRTADTQFQNGGFGQIITNPANGNFDSGDLVNFSFDYTISTGGTNGLIGAVYGIDAPNGTGATWNLSSGQESISSLGQSATPTIDGTDYTSGADYQFFHLHDSNLLGEQATASGTYTSGDFTLPGQYELFAVVFLGDPDGDGAGVITVDNVSFAAATAIPEPSTSLLIIGLFSVLGLTIRRRRTA